MISLSIFGGGGWGSLFNIGVWYRIHYQSIDRSIDRCFKARPTATVNVTFYYRLKRTKKAARLQINLMSWTTPLAWRNNAFANLDCSVSLIIVGNKCQIYRQSHLKSAEIKFRTRRLGRIGVKRSYFSDRKPKNATTLIRKPAIGREVEPPNCIF